MSNRNVGNSSGNPEENVNNFRKLEEATFNSIRKMLPDRVIVDICKQIKYEYRNRVISPVVTVLHMLLAAIWPEDSFNAGWQVLWNALPVSLLIWREDRRPEIRFPKPEKDCHANCGTTCLLGYRKRDKSYRRITLLGKDIALC